MRYKSLLRLCLCAASTMTLYGVVHAGQLTIVNCTEELVWVGAYNNNDKIMLIASTDACIKPGQSAALKCATDTCHVAGNQSSGCFPSHAEYQASMPDGSYIFWNGSVWRDPMTACPKDKNVPY